MSDFRTVRRDCGAWAFCLASGLFIGLVALAPSSAKAQTSAGVELTVSPPDDALQPEPALVVDPKTAVSDGAKALLAKDAAGAVRYFSAALAGDDLTREKRALLLNDRGVALWRKGDGVAAIADFNNAVSLYPEYAAIYNNRGIALLELGLADEAIKDFDRAVLLGPRYASAHANRAIAQMRSGRLDRALDDYDVATRLRPGDAASFLGRGRLHLAAGRPFAAERDLSKGVSLAPKLVELYDHRQRAREMIGRRSGAFQDLNQMVTLRPDRPAGRIARGKAYLAQGSRRSALKDFDAAIALDARQTDAYIGKARVLLSYKRVAQAREQANIALSLEPSAARVLALHADVLTVEGDAAAALAQARQAIRTDSQSVVSFVAKANAHEASGDAAAAAQSFTIAHKLEPSLQVAREGLKRLTGSVPELPPRVISGAGVDGWRVAMRRTKQGVARYFAFNDAYAGLEVPLETYDKAQPKLLAWNVRENVFRGIGVLRYLAGTREVKGKAVPVEQGTIVDLRRRIIAGIEPVKTGTKVAAWDWGDGALTVRGADGLVSTFALRAGVAAAAAAARKRRAEARRRADRRPDWLLDPWGIGRDTGVKPRRASRPAKQRKRRRKKKKTLFDLIFQ